MKKLILILGVVFVLSGCGNEGINNLEKGKALTDKISGNESSSNYVAVDDCLKGCAMLNGAMITEEACQGGCWAAEAKEKKDAKICDEKITKENSIMKTACYMNVAEETGEAKYCDSISDNKKDMMLTGCYSSVAKKYKKPEICESIKGSLLYDSCVTDAK